MNTSENFFLSGREEAWRIFETIQPYKIYGRNQMIYFQGDLAERFYYLKKGGVKIFLSSESGMEKTLAVLKPGDVFGEAAFFDGLPRVSSARTLEKSEIVSIDKPTLLEHFRQNPDLALHLLTFLARRVRMLSAQVDTMTFLQADQRLAQLLIHSAELSREGEWIVRATHEELGSLAGASRVTVSKILNGFARRGWVATRYRSLVLLDYEAIRQFAFAPQE